MQVCCRRLLPVFGIRCKISGDLPRGGLLVSNHLSYLDILVFGALCPSVFVAKREVKSWPVFGWLAILAGTVFLDRNRRSAVAQANAEITDALKAEQIVMLFPEGTSSDGSTVLPFKSSLLESAINLEQPITPACIHYSLSDGDPAEEVCYWKDMTFVPHLINLLTKSSIDVCVVVQQTARPHVNRKAMAQNLHSLVVRLHSQLVKTRACRMLSHKDSFCVRTPLSSFE